MCPCIKNKASRMKMTRNTVTKAKKSKFFSLYNNLKNKANILAERKPLNAIVISVRCIHIVFLIIDCNTIWLIQQVWRYT